MKRFLLYLFYLQFLLEQIRTLFLHLLGVKTGFVMNMEVIARVEAVKYSSAPQGFWHTCNEFFFFNLLFCHRSTSIAIAEPKNDTKVSN